MLKYLFSTVFLLSFLAAPKAQTTNAQDQFGNWNAWINSLVFSPKWRFDSDIHFRTWQMGKDPNTLILRGGPTFVALPWLELQAGYGYFEFYPHGDAVGLKPNSVEHRPHQQIFAKHKFKKFSFNHRLRLEERMIQTPVKKNIQRFRYRFYVAHPVVQKLYTFGSYEHFWTLSDWKFDQGRLHLGFGYPLGKHLKVEAAYLYHFLKNSVEYNRLQINFFSNLKLFGETKN